MSFRVGGAPFLLPQEAWPTFFLQVKRAECATESAWLFRVRASVTCASAAVNERFSALLDNLSRPSVE